MKREIFNTQFGILVAAYSLKRDDKEVTDKQEIYWRMLNKIPDAKFIKGIAQCLAEGKFFPTISEIGNACLPPVRDFKAKLSPLDHAPAMLNWKEQLDGTEEKKIARLKLAPPKKIDCPMCEARQRALDEANKKIDLLERRLMYRQEEEKKRVEEKRIQLDEKEDITQDRIELREAQRRKLQAQREKLLKGDIDGQSIQAGTSMSARTSGGAKKDGTA